MFNRFVPFIALASLLIGCGPETRTFDLTVRNGTTSPLTLVLTKDGPPYEQAWASPEDIKIGRVVLSADSRDGCEMLPPGKRATVKNITGQFNSNTQAILRVYRGDFVDHKANVLKVQPGPDRQDTVLKPGDNQFFVHDEAGNLKVDPASP